MNQSKWNHLQAVNRIYLSEINTEITAITITNLKTPEVLQNICNGSNMKKTTTFSDDSKVFAWTFYHVEPKKKKDVRKPFHKRKLDAMQRWCVWTSALLHYLSFGLLSAHRAGV